MARWESCVFLDHNSPKATSIGQSRHGKPLSKALMGSQSTGLVIWLNGHKIDHSCKSTNPLEQHHPRRLDLSDSIYLSVAWDAKIIRSSSMVSGLNWARSRMPYYTRAKSRRWWSRWLNCTKSDSSLPFASSRVISGQVPTSRSMRETGWSWSRTSWTASEAWHTT